MGSTNHLTRTLAGLVFVLPCTAWAWHQEGHQLIASLAVSLVHKDLPAWFAAGAPQISHCSVDPDVFKDKLTPQLRDAETPEHFIDLEYLDGAPLPATRPQYVSACCEKHLNPYTVGFLPYAIAEYAERLTMSFAESRRWPDNKEIQAKALVYAGILSHYAGDLSQPLHTTTFYDGKGKDGQPAKTGIHTKIDGLYSTYTLVPADTAGMGEILPLADLWAGIVTDLDKSHGLVDKVWPLEPLLPAPGKPAADDSRVKAFAREQLRMGTMFLARCYRSAWEDSKKIVLPDWEKR
jgi:hypothetical protein